MSVPKQEKIENLRTVAFVGVELERDALMGRKKEEVLKNLEEIPNIFRVYETLAPHDLMLELRTKNVEELRSRITTIAAIDGVMATNTVLTTNLVFDFLLPDLKEKQKAKAPRTKS